MANLVRRDHTKTMTARSITILGLLQTAALVFGILFTAVFRKIGLGPWSGLEPNFKLPLEFVVATRFSRYGILLALLIVAWVFWAARSDARISHPPLSASLLLISGLLLLLVIVVIGVLCSIWATILLWPN